MMVVTSFHPTPVFFFFFFQTQESEKWFLLQKRKKIRWPREREENGRKGQVYMTLLSSRSLTLSPLFFSFYSQEISRQKKDAAVAVRLLPADFFFLTVSFFYSSPTFI
eukprot:TRINITY_DN11784_c4_g1_i1.p1 TRINITY_DN11784_c4_g1~~TRINITY_DN11784_c4_g1_i1.p1  ORF type:complete len:108 (+),score=3.35 TRINITY_DN11784_c4_g1_i1:553-876(+)